MKAPRIFNVYDFILFGLVLWHIKYCRLFNAKSLSAYILNISDLVWSGFMAYQPQQVIQCQILFDLIWFGFMAYQSLSVYHPHHVVPLARISLTLSRHFSLSLIASGRSSGLHPVSSHGCWMYVRAGRPAFARPYVGVHWSTSLMSSSLLLNQLPACLVRLTCIVFVIGGRWPYSWWFWRYCRQDLFNIALNILVWLPSSFFSSRLVSVHVVHPYSSIDTTAAWKKLRFILSVRSDFHMIVSLSIAVHAFVSRVLMSFSVDDTLLPR